jgi:hypothetical protein
MLLFNSQFESYSFKVNGHYLSISFLFFLFSLFLFSPILLSFSIPFTLTLFISSFHSWTFFHSLISFIHFSISSSSLVLSFIYCISHYPFSFSPFHSLFLSLTLFHAEGMSRLSKHWKIYTTTQIPLRCRLHRYIKFPPCNAYTVVACVSTSKIWALLQQVKETSNLYTQIFPYLLATQSSWNRTSKHENNADTCSRKTNVSTVRLKRKFWNCRLTGANARKIHVTGRGYEFWCL